MHNKSVDFSNGERGELDLNIMFMFLVHLSNVCLQSLMSLFKFYLCHKVNVIIKLIYPTLW